MHFTYLIKIKGTVQGVGFRPFVYRCAIKNNILGYIFNDGKGVVICAQGTDIDIKNFLYSITAAPPPLSNISEIESIIDDNYSEYYKEFKIVESQGSSSLRNIVMPPDAHVCTDCLHELFNPLNRRYLYPFINCINCGPRYSIISDIPYDRPNTSMKHFNMCSECYKEYSDQNDRRFHAQPIACSVCGPRLSLLNNKMEVIDSANPLLNAVKFLQAGYILAVKSLGGYHLMVDPLNTHAVKKLRKRKIRDYKPFALLCNDIETCNIIAELDPHDVILLESTQRPIVLVTKKQNNPLPEEVSPNNSLYGIMLPSTPVQYLLLKNNFQFLVCTSANVSNNPIIYKDISKLLHVADYVLTNDREICIFSDDSIVRSISTSKGSETQIIRKARGFTPITLAFLYNAPSVLAVGAELKSTVCFSKDNNLLLSQHIGDLKNYNTYQYFENTITHLEKLFAIKPEIIISDLHPNFLSTKYARQKGITHLQVQHHHAHMCACMAENGLQDQVLGVIFDGMGYGIDGKIWGGEFLIGGYKNFDRFAHFKYFSLPGGEACSKNIYRIAFSFLFEIIKDIQELKKFWLHIIPDEEVDILCKMLQKSINTPLTSSVGRIFDCVASLIGLSNYSEYEGQAAIALEHLIKKQNQFDFFETYPFSINGFNPFTICINEAILAIIKDTKSNLSLEMISLKFHNTLVKVICDIAELARNKKNINNVVLSGGCFLNKFLLEASIDTLRKRGFEVFFHTKFPTNDGGIALGQASHAIFTHSKNIQ